MQEEAEVKKRINTIQIILTSIHENLNTELKPELRDRLFNNLCYFLFGSLPDMVIAIDIGERSINRDPQIIEDDEKGVRWNLKQIDDHGARLSDRIGQAWVPIIEQNSVFKIPLFNLV